ncbi:MAG: glycosyltransferase [Burkholderiales bacterium]|nr:glycosyltransferase [Burkholderiales bacterium]
MKKVLIISFSEIWRDPRVMRQIRLLESDCDVTVAGFGDRPEANIRFVELLRQQQRASLPRKLLWALKLLLGWAESYYWNQYEVVTAARLLSDTAPDLIIANDLPALPLALRLAKGKPVVYDAHEYSPRENEERWAWRLLFGRYNDALCRRHLPQVDSMLTVCQGIADEYARNYGVRPLVVHNAPQRQPLSPSPLDGTSIRMIHHGVASRSRQLELMIEIMNHLDQRFTLDLMLIEGETEYMQLLRQKAQHDPRIRFVDPVPMSQICQRTNAYDVGLFFLPPNSFNYRYALPNKFFEFVQARLAIAIGPSPEMAALVRKYECGVVAESFEPSALARLLQNLDPAGLTSLKAASHRAAEELCFEQAAPIVLSEVRRLGGLG